MLSILKYTPNKMKIYSSTIGKGTVPFESTVNVLTRTGVLHEVLHISNLGANLFSVGAAEKGITGHFREAAATFTNGIDQNKRVVMTGTRIKGSIYQVNIVTKKGPSTSSASPSTYAA